VSETESQGAFNKFYLYSGEEVPKDNLNFAPYFLLNELEVAEEGDGFGFIEYKSEPYEFTVLDSNYGEQKVVVNY